MPELYAARTIGWPPVATIRSARAISACDIGMLTLVRHCRMSAGAPSRSSASRISRTVSNDVFFERGCGEKITTSRALIAVDRVAGGRQVRVGRRHDAGDDARRLAVLDDALLGQLLDDADALLAQRVAQHAADLHPLAHPAHGVAETALLDAHVDQPRERLLVGDRPGHRLAQPVDARLVVGLDDRERLARAREHVVELLLLFLGDALLRFRSAAISASSRVGSMRSQSCGARVRMWRNDRASAPKGVKGVYRR